MGQQQFLLIALTVVVVALVVAVSIAMFLDQSAASNRDALSNDLVNMASRAQEYYRRPIMMGGGGGSFKGFTLGTYTHNADGTFELGVATQTTLTIKGSGIELGYDTVNPVKLVI